MLNNTPPPLLDLSCLIFKYQFLFHFTLLMNLIFICLFQLPRCFCNFFCLLIVFSWINHSLSILGSKLFISRCKRCKSLRPKLFQLKESEDALLFSRTEALDGLLWVIIILEQKDLKRTNVFYGF